MQRLKKRNPARHAIRLGCIALGAASLPVWFLAGAQGSDYEHKELVAVCSLVPFFLLSILGIGKDKSLPYVE
ncbi:hypothetical protein [Pseudomonas sp.]|uniref:hypothetical protein n=1 Tax=Pseudomonas sp. TaxID=306 RepID=UPI00289CEBED|nr:hypothetical protein [Pseudomonas sp.]